ncbi:MAG: NUDIX hydrolase [Filomicrobium sp.]
MRKTRQVAALPIRHREDGTIEVCLVTTRETQRWVIPKGWATNKRTNAKMAALEALEEAGLEGKISGKPLGFYRYFKRQIRTFELVRVEVFTMTVEKERKKWPEADQRERIWVSPAEAATMVVEPGLSALLADFEPAGNDNSPPKKKKQRIKAPKQNPTKLTGGKGNSKKHKSP